MGEDQLRRALVAYQAAQGISCREHARRLGVGAMTLHGFLAGRFGPGARMLRAIRREHPELLPLLLGWLAGGKEATVK